MDICELRDKLFGRGVTDAAIVLDAEGVREVEEQHQRDWDDGISYTGIAFLLAMFGKRIPSVRHMLLRNIFSLIWRRLSTITGFPLFRGMKSLRCVG